MKTSQQSMAFNVYMMSENKCIFRDKNYMICLKKQTKKKSRFIFFLMNNYGFLCRVASMKELAKILI